MDKCNSKFEKYSKIHSNNISSKKKYIKNFKI